VTDLKLDFDDVRAPAVATEFVSSSISSGFGRSQLEVQVVLADNPHVRLADGSRRGYVRMEVTRDRLRADLRAVRTVTQPASDVETLASFIVEDGRPGAVPA
jgi:alkaline phosphatase D